MSPRFNNRVERSRGTNCFRCRVCRGIHPLRKCRSFLRLNAEKRLRAVLINKYCANCLAHEHSEGTCRSRDKCRICHHSHHTLLHFHEKVRRRSTPIQSATQIQSPSLTTLLDHRNPKLLPTAIILIDNGNTVAETRALIDPCAPVSLIDASFASAMRLPSLNIGQEAACTAVIRSKASDGFRLDAILKHEHPLRIRTPLTVVNPVVRERFEGLVLADDNFHKPSTISIVLGADVYSDIAREGFHANRAGGPVALRTVFGWTLSGTCSS